MLKCIVYFVGKWQQHHKVQKEAIFTANSVAVADHVSYMYIEKLPFSIQNGRKTNSDPLRIEKSRIPFCKRKTRRKKINSFLFIAPHWHDGREEIEWNRKTTTKATTAAAAALAMPLGYGLQRELFLICTVIKCRQVLFILLIGVFVFCFFFFFLVAVVRA